MPLNDNQQALVVLASIIFIAIGALAVPTGYPWWVGFGVMLAGAIGLALKEYSGAVPKVG